MFFIREEDLYPLNIDLSYPIISVNHKDLRLGLIIKGPQDRISDSNIDIQVKIYNKNGIKEDSLYNWNLTIPIQTLKPIVEDIAVQINLSNDKRGSCYCLEKYISRDNIPYFIFSRFNFTEKVHQLISVNVSDYQPIVIDGETIPAKKEFPKDISDFIGLAALGEVTAVNFSKKTFDIISYDMYHKVLPEVIRYYYMVNKVLPNGGINDD